MKKVSARSSDPIRFHPLLSVITFCFGIIAAVLVTHVLAQQALLQINACVQKQTGNVRIVLPTSSCRPDETPMAWAMQGPPGPAGPPGPSSSSGLPFICSYCNLTPYADKFKGGNFSKIQLNTVEFSNVDLTGTIFKGGVLEYVNFSGDNLSNTDFSNMVDLPNWSNSNENFTNANLTDANLSNSNFSYTNFSGTNLQGTNFSNTSFINTNFSGSHNMSTANVTGVTWTNVTCPDGTSSSNHSNTCVGHF